MIHRFFLVFLLLAVFAGTASCSAIRTTTVTPGFVSFDPGTLQPYQTQLPFPTAAISPTVEIAAEPSSTPTPRRHVVKAGEDMGSISLLFGVSLAELIAANPEVNPRMMSVGMELIIPPAEGSTGSQGPTPAPAVETVDVNQPACYPTVEQALWCLVNLRNPGENPVESVTLRFHMDSAGENSRQWLAASPLDRIPAGSSIPVAAYFSKPIPSNPGMNVELVTALPSTENDQRYLPVRLDGVKVDISEGGTYAGVQGRVLLELPESIESPRIWVLLAAYDQSGIPLGVRRWESKGVLNDLEGISFNARVYSLGGIISSVEAFVEARR